MPATAAPIARRTPPTIPTFRGPALSCQRPAMIMPTAKKNSEAMYG